MGTAGADGSGRAFKKPASVFAKWRTDDDATRQKYLDHDFDNWKLDRFELRDLVQCDGVKKIIYDNFFFLKAIFLEIASETAFPKVTPLGFSSLCQRCGLIDNANLRLADVDRFFIAARRIDGEKQEDQNIIRHRFIEAISRVAFKRFYNDKQGEAEDRVEAMQMCVDKMKKSWSTQNWEEWRWKYLYNVPVHETLYANYSHLTKLHQTYRKANKKYPDLQDIQTMFADVGDPALGPS